MRTGFQIAAATAGVLISGALAFAQTERTDVYRPDGTRSTYMVTNQRTGWTEVYDAKTSRRLGGFRTPESAFRPDGTRVPGGAPELILPGGRATGKNGRK